MKEAKEESVRHKYIFVLYLFCNYTFFFIKYNFLQNYYNKLNFSLRIDVDLSFLLTYVLVLIFEVNSLVNIFVGEKHHLIRHLPQVSCCPEPSWNDTNDASVPSFVTFFTNCFMTVTINIY